MNRPDDPRWGPLTAFDIFANLVFILGGLILLAFMVASLGGLAWLAVQAWGWLG